MPSAPVSFCERHARGRRTSHNEDAHPAPVIPSEAEESHTTGLRTQPEVHLFSASSGWTILAASIRLSYHYGFVVCAVSTPHLPKTLHPCNHLLFKHGEPLAQAGRACDF